MVAFELVFTNVGAAVEDVPCMLEEPVLTVPRMSLDGLLAKSGDAVWAESGVNSHVPPLCRNG